MSFPASTPDPWEFGNELERIARRMEVDITGETQHVLDEEHIVALDHADGTEYLLGDSDGILWIGACGGVLWTP